LTSKPLRLILITAICTILLAPTFLAHANAASITVVVNNSSVSVNIGLRLTENVTTSLPPIDARLDYANLTVVEAAIKSKVPTAHIDLLTMHANFSLVDPTIGLWIIDENYTITVSGLNKNTGGRIMADLSFLSISVLDPITTSDGHELNGVGAAYLLQGIERFSPENKTRYYLGSSQFTEPVIPETTTRRFSLLDLSWIPSVSKWSGEYQPFQPNTIWNFTPRQIPYNLTIALGLTPEGTFLRRYVAFLNPSVEIIAPARAQAQGSMVIFDLPTAAEIIMPVIIGVSIVAAVTTFLLDRKLSRAARQAGRRKR